MENPLEIRFVSNLAWFFAHGWPLYNMNDGPWKSISKCNILVLVYWVCGSGAGRGSKFINSWRQVVHKRHLIHDRMRRCWPLPVLCKWAIRQKALRFRLFICYLNKLEYFIYELLLSQCQRLSDRWKRGMNRCPHCCGIVRYASA